MATLTLTPNKTTYVENTPGKVTFADSTFVYDGAAPGALVTQIIIKLNSALSEDVVEAGTLVSNPLSEQLQALDAAPTIYSVTSNVVPIYFTREETIDATGKTYTFTPISIISGGATVTPPFNIVPTDASGVEALIQSLTYIFNGDKNVESVSRVLTVEVKGYDSNSVPSDPQSPLPAEVTLDTDTTSLTVENVNDQPTLIAQDYQLASTPKDTTSATGTLVSSLLNDTSITDPDGTAVEAIYITAINTSKGALEFKLAGATTWTAISFADANAGKALLLGAGDAIRLNPTAGATGIVTDAITFGAWDQSDKTTHAAGSYVTLPASSASSPYSASTDTASINITAPNAAPVFTPSPFTFTAISEDTTNPAGVLVSNVVPDGKISDADSTTPPEAIYIKALTGTGSWEYQLAGSSTWTAFTVSTGQARLLDANDKVRFVPAANFNGEATFTYGIWDKSDGTAGANVTLPGTLGGSTAFSTATATATQAITAVNDAPVLRTSDSPTLTAIDEGAVNNAGNTVASFVVDGSITDVDVTTVPENIYLTAVDMANGSWQFKLGSGSWTAVPTLSPTSVLPLLSTDSLRFVPNSGFKGSATLTFGAWDATAGTAGMLINPASSAFSTAVDTASITVKPVNAAPVLNTSGAPALKAIAEDVTTTDNVGTAIADLVIDGSITDSNTTTPPEAIYVRSVDTTNGTWQFKSGAGTWTDVPSLSATNVLLLDSTDSLRFLPKSNFNGTSSMTFGAWDKTAGTAGTTVTTAANSALSTATDTATITVTAVNDAPVLDVTKTPAFTTIAEDVSDSANTGTSVGTLVVNGSITDVDVTTAPEAIYVKTIDNANGVWQYKLANGSWADITGLSPTSVLLLDSSDALRFVPNPDYNGSSSISFGAWDKSNLSETVKAGSLVDTTGSTAYSSATDTAAITITGVNDSAPQLDSTLSLTLASVVEDVTGDSNAGTTVASLLPNGAITDADLPSGTAAAKAIQVRSLDNSNGVWQFKLAAAGSNWTPIVLTGSNAGKGLLLGPTDSLRFVPATNYNGPSSITFGAWDQSTGKAGDYLTTTGAGTSTSALSLDTLTVGITVTPVNDAPVATPDMAVTTNATAVTLAPLGNDLDPENDTLTLVSAALKTASQGTLDKLTDGTLKFTPANGFTGTAEFTYVVQEANGLTSTGKGAVLVLPASQVVTDLKALTSETLVGVFGSNDLLAAGRGDDVYIISDSGDRIVEKGRSGLDQVQSLVSVDLSSKAFQNVENALLLGTGNLSLTGSRAGNVLVGNAGNNVLTGGRGIDTLTGGDGKDTFVLNSLRAGDIDRITDFVRGTDVIALSTRVFKLADRDFDGKLDTGVIRYNATSGEVLYDSNGTRAGGEKVIAIVGSNLGLTEADFILV